MGRSITPNSLRQQAIQAGVKPGTVWARYRRGIRGPKLFEKPWKALWRNKDGVRFRSYRQIAFYLGVSETCLKKNSKKYGLKRAIKLLGGE